MALIGSTLLDGWLSSARQTGKKVLNALGKEIPEMVETFISGFGGSGWKIWKKDGKWNAEFDELRVRGTMAVHEMVIQKIRAVCGALGISQACGKVESVREDSDYYYLKMEGDKTSGYGGFAAGDLVRCQRWTETGVKGYWVEVDSVTDGELKVAKSEFKGCIVDENKQHGSEQVLSVTMGDVAISFDGQRIGLGETPLTVGGDEPYDTMISPSAGDELVQYGSTTNENRRTAIYLHATEDDEPAMDILFGIKEKTFDGCLKVRLGGGLPGGGVGLYCEDGHIVAKNGSEILYEFKPSGYFNLGRGQFVYDPEKDVLTLGEKVVIRWSPPSIESQTEYAIGSDPTVPPKKGWSADYPQTTAGDYVWSRTLMKYSDGSSQGEYIYTVSRIGVDGTSVGVASTRVSYAVTTTYSRPSSFPYTTVPSVNAGEWLWSKTVVTFSDGKSATSYAATYSGKDGLNVHRNLMDWTDFVFKEGMYGNILRFGADASKTAALSSVGNDGIHGSETISCQGNTASYTDMFEIPVNLDGSQWYTLSYYAKGGDVQSFVYPGIVDTSQKVFADGSIQSAATDGGYTFAGSDAWTRHFYTFKTKTSAEGAKVLFRIPQNGSKVSLCLVSLTPGVRGKIETSGMYSYNSMVSENAKDGANSLVARPFYGDYSELMSENVTGSISAGGDYTLSFLVRGSGTLHTFVWGGGIESPLDKDFRCLVDGEALSSYVSDGDVSWAVSSDWVKHTFTFRTKAEGMGKVYVLFRAMNAGIEICQVKLEAGESATDWSESSQDRTAKLPDWVEDWDGHSTEINGIRVVSPQGFFGEKKEGKLTGILMGARALSGYETGLYALKDGETKVAIDPVNGKYEFRGTLVADEGQFNGMVFGSYYKSNVVVTKDNFSKLFEERLHYAKGPQIKVPVWSRIAQVIVFNTVPDETGFDVEFYLPPYYYNGTKIPTAEDYAMGLSMLGSTLVLLNRTDGEESSSIKLHGKFLASGSSVSSLSNDVPLNSGRCLYLTCKITSGGVIYFEKSEFSEPGNSPSFPGTVIPLKPDDYRKEMTS